MKFKILLTVLIFSLLQACGTNDSTQNLPKPKNFNDEISYSFGYTTGQQIAQDTITDINIDYFLLGVRHGQDSAKFKAHLTKEERDSIVKTFSEQMQAKMQEQQEQEEQAFKDKGNMYKEKGPDFLAENKTKEGVEEAASGLQYKVLRKGDGPKPKPDDFVQVHLIGSFMDGEEFDNTYERNPISIPVNKPAGIEGLGQALKMMQVGGKWKIWVPANLAFGEKGAGRTIPPNAILIYEVELIKILNEEEKQQQIKMMQQSMQRQMQR